MEKSGQDNNYGTLAPRPWRSFTDSHISAMVVRKRRAPPPPLQKILINAGSDENIKREKKRAPTPPIRTVSLKSPGPEKNGNEETIESVCNENLSESGSTHNSVFDTDNSDQNTQQILSYETASPISPISFKSSMELEISVDGNVIEDELLDHKTSKTDIVDRDSSYERIYDDTEKKYITNGEETSSCETKEITENCKTINGEDGTKIEITTTEEVHIHSTKKKIDLVIRTSQIEDLDESEQLKECTENGDITDDSTIETEEQANHIDEADFSVDSEKRKSEIIMKVEKLEDSLNQIISDSFPVTNDDLSTNALTTPEQNYSSSGLSSSHITGQKLSISGWTEFAKGTRWFLRLETPKHRV